ncbi:MAG: transposase [Candidatus Competibacteraceae bacterium]|nr:transposase [Candidatus Competibacteraceae bacterium]
MEYKAKREGVFVQYVDPRNTSRQCAACGHIDKANRKAQSRFQCVLLWACCECGPKRGRSTIAARANVN